MSIGEVNKQIIEAVDDIQQLPLTALREGLDELALTNVQSYLGSALVELATIQGKITRQQITSGRICIQAARGKKAIDTALAGSENADGIDLIISTDQLLMDVEGVEKGYPALAPLAAQIADLVKEAQVKALVYENLRDFDIKGATIAVRTQSEIVSAANQYLGGHE
jgi:hypothetical protein